MSDGEPVRVGCLKNASKTKKEFIMSVVGLLIIGVLVAISLANTRSETANHEETTTNGTTGDPNTPTYTPNPTPTTILTTDSPTGSPPITGQPPTTSQPRAERKMFAHFYLSATKRYDESNLSTGAIGVFEWDIGNAIQAKLDGFIVNVCSEEWELERLEQIYQAASNSRFSNFQLFVNLNLTCQVNRNVTLMISILERNVNKTAQFKIEGRTVFGVHEGEELTFDPRNRTKGWIDHFIEPLKKKGINVYLIPYWPSTLIEKFFQENSFVDGFQSFKAWPFGYEPVDYESDSHYIEAAHNSKVKKTIISAVSPGYFSHFVDNNLVYRSEDAWHERWEQLIKHKADIGQVVSWNGFHESHAVGPINPYSSVGDYHWYKNMSNEVFTKMLPYYVEWFKTGKQPPLTENVVYFYHRPHSLYVPQASKDSIPKPITFKQAKDVFVIHSFIKDDDEYHAQIKINGKPMPGRGPVVLTGGKPGHFLVPFNELVGKVELVLTQNQSNCEIELARTPVDNPTELIDWNKVEKWNFNFNSRVITF